MKLHSLKMKNWRSFIGETQTIRFSTDKEKNVTVIHASNGVGKTNILNAILWLFFEKTSPNFRNPQQIINKNAILQAAQGAVVECEVEVVFDHDNKRHRAARSAACIAESDLNRSIDRLNVRPLSVTYETDSGSWADAPNPQTFIEKIIPPTIRDFFFFDGEDLHAKFRHDEISQKHLAQQMRTFFGLDYFQDAMKVFEKATASLLRDVKQSGDDKLAQLAKEIEDLSKEAEHFDERLEATNKEISFRNNKISLIDKSISEQKEAAELHKQRQDLEAQINESQEQLDKNQRIRAKEIAKNAYALFLNAPLIAFKSKMENLESRGELPSDVKRPFVDTLIETDKCMCGRSIKDDPAAAANINEWRNKAGLTDVEQSVLRMKNRFEDIEKQKESFAKRLTDHQHARLDHKQEYDRAQQKLNQISTTLQESDVEQIQELENDRQSEHDKLQSLNRELGGFETKRSSVKDKILLKEAEMKRLETASRNALLKNKRHSVARDATECLSKLFRSRDSRVRKDLLEKIHNRYQGLMWKKNFEPRLDENYRLDIFETHEGSSSVDNSDGNNQNDNTDVEAQKGTLAGLSGGEIQVLAFAFIGSIIEIQKEHAAEKGLIAIESRFEEYCILADSPYGSLGGAYRNAVSKYLPKVTDQVILLVTDSQWEGAAKRALRDRTAKQYVLKQHATPEAFEKHTPKSIEIHGREYELVQATTKGHDWAEIVEINNE